MNAEKIVGKITALVQPIVTEKGYDLYHIEFVEEDGENYLRIIIDSDNGISLTDCEAVSRPISSLLDEKDPISVGYYLEVSSPGIERTLFTDRHLQKYINFDVVVKLNSLFNGKKEFTGILKSFNDKEITINDGNEDTAIPGKIIKQTNLKD
jgi:ribosome maturation factor RimP